MYSIAIFLSLLFAFFGGEKIYKKKRPPPKSAKRVRDTGAHTPRTPGLLRPDAHLELSPLVKKTRRPSTAAACKAPINGISDKVAATSDARSDEEKNTRDTGKSIESDEEGGGGVMRSMGGPCDNDYDTELTGNTQQTR